MADNQKYTAEEKARHAARVKEREARKKERQKQKKALTKQAAPAPKAPATNGGHKTYDASLLKRARNVGGPPYEAFLKYLPHDCPIAASRRGAFTPCVVSRRGGRGWFLFRFWGRSDRFDRNATRRHGAAGDAVLCRMWCVRKSASHPERPGHG